MVSSMKTAVLAAVAAAMTLVAPAFAHAHTPVHQQPPGQEYCRLEGPGPGNQCAPEADPRQRSDPRR
jgi:hypothetical protein